MGLRTRIKGRIQRALGQEEGPTRAAPAAETSPRPPVRVTPKPEAAPDLKEATPASEVAPLAEPKSMSVAQASPKTAAADGPKPISEEKVQKHMRKTRKGVLKMVIDSGGSSTLGEMHDYSERRYFVAHKKFSDLMESLISSGQIDYDAAESVATITEVGRALVAES